MEQELLPVSDRDGVRSQQSGPTPTSDHVAVTVGESPQSPGESPPQSPVVPASVHRMEGLAELEIRSLLWMEQKGNEMLKRAYVEWERKELLFASRIDQKKQAILPALRNEIYQLIGFYIVFQGVLLTVVAQSNLLYCYNWWTVFFLSLFASMVTIGGVIQKFWGIWGVEMSIKLEMDSRQECINRMSRLRQKRGDFNFDRDAGEGIHRYHFRKWFRWSVAFVTVILVTFSSFFLISIYRVLCHPHAPAPTAAAS